jgi:hypothetical protein
MNVADVVVVTELLGLNAVAMLNLQKTIS